MKAAPFSSAAVVLMAVGQAVNGRPTPLIQPVVTTKYVSTSSSVPAVYLERTLYEDGTLSFGLTARPNPECARVGPADVARIRAFLQRKSFTSAARIFKASATSVPPGPAILIFVGDDIFAFPCGSLPEPVGEVVAAIDALISGSCTPSPPSVRGAFRQGCKSAA